MKKIRIMMNYLLLTSGVAVLASCANTAPPAESFDGLVLVPNTRFAQVYRRPGVNLSAYHAYGLTNCDVAFRKDWLRDHNQSTMNLNSRVTQEDVAKIKESLGGECEKTFREALERPPAYPLVEHFNEGEQVLVLRPSIINLDITAPDTGLQSPGRQRTYTTDAGQMTLLLEGLDATTGEILLRVVDRRRDSHSTYLQWTNSVTNRADAQRILNSWAQQLREGLDEVNRAAAPQ